MNILRIIIRFTIYNKRNGGTVMIQSIYINTLEDALLAYEVMEEFYGDCDIRCDKRGEYHLIKPRSWQR